ncbi:MAG: AarF/ABC1/UbiB kinase family protein [Cyanobacteria bacterium]|nr:AarF/ABC1/UbiB kinase family protein [Cyanobacteriota bacterium]
MVLDMSSQWTQPKGFRTRAISVYGPEKPLFQNPQFQARFRTKPSSGSESSGQPNPVVPTPPVTSPSLPLTHGIPDKQGTSTPHEGILSSVPPEKSLPADIPVGNGLSRLAKSSQLPASLNTQSSKGFFSHFSFKPIALPLNHKDEMNQALGVLKSHYIKSKIRGWVYLTRTPAKEAEVLTAKLTDKLLTPLLSNPEQSKEIIGLWEAQIKEQYAPGVVRDAALFGLKHLKNNVDKPEALKKSVNLFSIIMTHGGYQKLIKIVKITQSPEFKQADETKRGQMVLEGLGSIFIKACQTISTMPNLFEPHIQASMNQLYEDITPVPFAQIKQIIEKELNIPFEQAYDQFDETPLKVGSIAQVHKAMLGGKPVVVKVVKPGVVDSLKEDIALLTPLIDLAQMMAPHVDIKEVFEDFAGKVMNETNMARQLPGDPEGEADRLKGMKEALKDAPNVIVPAVFDSHTRKRILTMEFIPGQSLLGFKNNPDVAKGYLNLLMDQIFTYGYCQADPHPGNILFNVFTNKYGCIDAGLAYNVPKQERIDFAKLLIAIVSKDSELICDAVLGPNSSKHPNFAKYKAEIAAMCPNADAMDYKLTLKFLNNAAKLAHQNGMETKQINPMLWKTLFTAVAVAKTLDPSVGISMPAVTRLAFLFLKNNNAGYMMNTSYRLLAGQVSGGFGWLKDRWNDLGKK